MSVTIVDSHCHVYSERCLDWLIAAHEAMPQAADKVICVVETKKSQWFGYLSKKLHHENLGSIEHLSAVGLLWNGSAEEGLTSFIKAEQVNTRERIEVIVVGCEYSIEENLPVESYIDRYADRFLVILPWGVGKWLGKRGQIVSELLNHRTGIVLGDNGGRPSWWKVSQFQLANELNVPVLRGSDPLPVPSYHRRVLGYADCVGHTFNNGLEWMKWVKQGYDDSVGVYGGLNSIHTFVAEQIGIRVK